MKIRKILDFVGNKILNVKVNNPTDNEHITNKQYVDEKSIYNTTLSSIQNSTKFDWVKNVGGNTLKTVLDKLLFPVVNPVYINPTFNKLNFTTSKKNYIENETINTKLIFEIVNPDRNVVNQNTVIEITDTNNVITTFNSNDFTLKGYINFTIVIGTLVQVKIKKNFGIAVVRNDSNGNPFIDSNFNSTYTLEKILTKTEFLDYIQSTNVFPQLYFKNSLDKATNLQTFLDSDISTFIAGNVYQGQLYIPSLPFRNICLVLIHPDLLKQQFVINYTNLNNQMLSQYLPNTFEFYGLLLPTATTATDFYTKLINGVNYYALELDFGKANTTRKNHIILL